MGVCIIQGGRGPQGEKLDTRNGRASPPLANSGLNFLPWGKIRERGERKYFKKGFAEMNGVGRGITKRKPSP